MQKRPSLWEGAFIGAASVGAAGAAFGGYWGALIGIVLGAAWGAWWMRRGQWVVEDRTPTQVADQGPYRDGDTQRSACCCTEAPCPCACHTPPKEPSTPFSPLRPIRRALWAMLFEPLPESDNPALDVFAFTGLSLVAAMIVAIPLSAIAYVTHSAHVLWWDFASFPAYWIFRFWLRSALHLDEDSAFQRWKARIHDR